MRLNAQPVVLPCLLVALKEKINIMHVAGFAVMAVGAAIVFYARGRV